MFLQLLSVVFSTCVLKKDDNSLFQKRTSDMSLNFISIICITEMYHQLITMELSCGCRLEKLECMKRQSQEEIGLLNGMNSLPSAGGGYNGPSSVWEPKLGAARCNTLSEHDEFVSLPPMSPSSTSPGDTTSSGNVNCFFFRTVRLIRIIAIQFSPF